MTEYRCDIRALIDPEQTELMLCGRHLQHVSVIMTDPPEVDEHASAQRPPSAVTLRPEQARRLAIELLDRADRADRAGVPR